MLIKIHTDIIVDVKDKEEGEDACHDLSMGLTSALRGFPHEVIDARVDFFENVSAEEAKEEGWDEE